MKYTVVIAALIGLISVEQVRATQQINNKSLADETLVATSEFKHNSQMDNGEDAENDDEEDNEEYDVDDEDDGGDDDDDTLIYEGAEMYADNYYPDDQAYNDDEDLQIDQGLQSGQFEMMDDTLVNEDLALEMEQLQYQYKPHNVETIGLESDFEDVPNDDDYIGLPSEEMNLQLSDDLSKTFFTAEMDGHGGLGEPVYERVVPAKYADGGDSFMASMIQNYALEGKNEDGTPTGKFFMNEAITKQAAAEILKTHKKLEGKELEDYLNQYFARTFAHFDVTKDGLLSVDVMPQFMRFLASDQSMQLD
jgi:hypothetical protein